jgi:hypothetical protein
VFEGDVGILLRQLRHDGAPKPRCFQHVGLVDRGQLAPPLPRARERHAGDALDLVTRIDQGIEGGVARGFEAARFAVIQPAEQFADD